MNRQRTGLASPQLQREEGTIVKDWGGRLPIALIYPSSYDIGMSSLGVHAIYRLLNRDHNVVCERVFWGKDNALPLSLESGRPLSDFPVLAFSVTYELDYFHIPEILKAAGIPLFASERDASHPVIIAGGPCITANPMPLAPFFDALCIGEAEPIIPAILPVLAETGTLRRNELRQRLSALPGVYVPQFYEGKPVRRQYAENLDDFPVSSVIMTRDTEFGDMYLIEAERGCNWGCRFCLVGNTFSPVRFRARETLLAQAKEGLKYRGRLGLVGPDVSGYPELEELLGELGEMGAGISVSSLRVKPFPRTVLRELVRSGATTVTLAPETGAPHLWCTMGKGINRDDVLSAVSSVAEEGIRQLKLYFMVGLPAETDEDVTEIARLALMCKEIIDRKRAGARLILSVAPFVPKAGTPWERLPMAPLSVLNRRLSGLRDSLPARGISLKLESPAWSEVQAVLARGGTELANVLADAGKLSLASWRRAGEKHHLDISFYAHERWGHGVKLPWEVRDLGVKTG
ncbi:MAG: radical SAM protein [Chloroflexota bacterium]